MESSYTTTPKTKKTIDSLWRLGKIILDTLDFKDVVQKIVDSVLLELGYLKLGYEIVVLCLIDEKGEFLKRVSISRTEKAKRALELTPVPFEKILIPLNYKENALIRAIDRVEPQIANRWPDILMPSFSEKDALEIQDNLAITTSLVYPVISRSKPIGAIIFSMSKSEANVTEDERDLIKSYSDIVGLAVQNSRLYTQLKESQEGELEKARELLKLKDEFVFVATHDLKTPVTAIDGFVNLIQERHEKFSAKTKDSFKAIIEASDRLKELTNDLLEVARSESGTIKVEVAPINIVDIIRNALKEVEPKAKERKITITAKFAPRQIVLADRAKVFEVLENLLSNAVKYNKDGGLIEVTTQRQGNALLTSVSNTGREIPKKDQSRIFQKFFRSEQPGTEGIGGTGLGLFVSRMLIEKMHGKISFVSGEGKGTTFMFTLPLSNV